MLPNKQLSHPVPTTETGTLIPSMTSPANQGPPICSNVCMALTALKFLVLVALILFILLCQMMLPVKNMKEPRQTKKPGKCLVPAAPEHGTHIYAPASKPGESLESLNLTVICPPRDYAFLETKNVYCRNGSWSDSIPKCVQCGRVAKGMSLMSDGRSAKQGVLPWHVGIYQKNKKSYKQICGGSIISETVVITAAHCFWNDVTKLRPASEYAVAAGKIYRNWNNRKDTDAQNSDVKEINIPDYFQGSATNFQADIAVIILKNRIVFTVFVKPICLDFDVDFDSKQLQPGKLAKVGGWGLTAVNGNASKTLQIGDMSYVGVEECYALVPRTFREYITFDKICARGNGTMLLKGDSGGALVFCEPERGRCYIRGITSTAPTHDKLNQSEEIVGLTHIQLHEIFIKSVLDKLTHTVGNETLSTLS